MTTYPIKHAGKISNLFYKTNSLFPQPAVGFVAAVTVSGSMLLSMILVFFQVRIFDQ